MTKLAAVRRAKVGDVRNWVEALGVLCSDTMTPTEAEMKVLAYVPMLQSDFPPEAFCQDSLSAVVRKCRYFPSYSDVHAHLRAWWREHRPLPPALPPPAPIRQRDEPTEAEKAHVTRIVAELTAELRRKPLDYEVLEGNNELPPQQEDPQTRRPRAYHLTPAQLDIVNPLPDGKKRVPELLK
jgi:hypothetical protein